MAPSHPDSLRCSSLFRKDWDVYRKLLDGDYMHHRSLFTSVQHFLEQHCQHKFSLLDLGCGDSLPAAKMLSASPSLATNLTHYVGVDMSLPAMTLSASNLTAALPASCSIEYIQGDMLSFARACQPGSFDVVLAAFSIHHLEQSQKRELLQLVGRILRPAGCFCLVDVFRESGETRQDYLDRLKAAMGSWHSLDALEHIRMFGHVSECDYPEDLPTYTAWLQQQQQQSPLGIQVLCEKDKLYKALAVQLPAAS